MLSPLNAVPAGRRGSGAKVSGLGRLATHRPAVGSAFGVALALLATAPAAHALSISAANVNPPEFADASTRNVIYYLDLHAGPQDERFSVGLRPPAFATKGGHDEGRSIDGPRQLTLVGGPGTVGQLITEPSIGEICSDRDSAYHGYATGASTLDVQLPANANTTLAIRYAVGRRAPWPDTDLTLRFSIQQKLFGTYDGTSPLFGAATAVDGAQTITATPTLAVRSAGGASKIGAHILLSPSPRGTWGDERAPRAVKSGAAITVSGQVLAAGSGKRIDLQWRKGTGALRLAKALRTTTGGRFTTQLSMPGKGRYELWARYPTQSGGLRSDTTSCPISYVGR